MNAVHNRTHPNVILLGYPLKRTVVKNQMKTENVSSNSFPVLAVTRSNTAPCFVVSKSHPQKKTEPERQSSNIIYENTKRSSQLHKCKNQTDVVKCESPRMPAKNDLANRTRPRASSLPVWPVTDPNIIRNLANRSTRTLPRPRVSANLVIYSPKRRNSACSGVFNDGQSDRDKTDNTRRCPIIVSSKQPSRCETPMSEYDPDKLSIKQVVKFLNNNDQEFSLSRSHSYRGVADARPRPVTVAYTDSNTHDVAKSGHHRTTKHRKSPPAAKRYTRSAKSTNSIERALSVSTLVMSDKRHSRRAKKIEKLANLAARYNPDIKVHNKTDTSNTYPQTFQEVSGNLSKECFGKLKYEAASFHSFPTNKAEIVSEEICTNGRANDNDEPDPEAEAFDVRASGSEIKNPTHNVSDGAAFNAITAIRLPSVFDNIDAETEVDRKAGYWSMPASFEQLTVSDNSDSPQSDPTITGPCFRLNSHHYIRDYRHRRNLSMVLSRERSSEFPLCANDAPEKKIKQTRNWVNFSSNDNSKVVELKLTHGLPPHL